MLYRVTLKRVRDQVSERRTSTLLKIYKQSLKDLHSVTAAFVELFFISSRFNYEVHSLTKNTNIRGVCITVLVFTHIFFSIDQI